MRGEIIATAFEKVERQIMTDFVDPGKFKSPNLYCRTHKKLSNGKQQVCLEVRLKVSLKTRKFLEKKLIKK